MLLGYFTCDFSPFVPLLPHTETFGIRYYGLSYLSGFVGAAWLFKLYADRHRSLLPRSQIMDFMVAVVMGVVIGGRLGSFLLYHFDELIHDPLSFFRVWEGGMASHGGFIGVALGVAWFARSRRIPFVHLADLVSSTAPLGLMLGRLANFINGELWGKPATVAWAVIFPKSPLPIVPRHPSQLYEAALEGALLLTVMQWRFWKSDVVQRRPGRLSGEFLIVYALVRAFGELFREPDADLILGLSRGTFYSIFVLLAGLALVLVPRKPLPRTHELEKKTI